jgi:hypothetical protein
MTHEEERAGRLEEREQRQQAEQQHGDTFEVETDQPTDTSGIPRSPTEWVQGQTEPSSPERQVTREMAEEQGSTPAVGEEPDAASAPRSTEEGRPGTGDRRS